MQGWRTSCFRQVMMTLMQKASDMKTILYVFVAAALLPACAAGNGGGTAGGSDGGTGGGGSGGGVSGGSIRGLGGADTASLEPGGVTLWSRRFGTTGDQGGGPFAVDGSNNIVLSGSFASTMDWGNGPHTAVGPTDLYVARIDAEGTTRASRQYGGPLQDDGTAIVGPYDETVLAGSFQGNIDFGTGAGAMISAGGLDLFLAKLDAAGTPV